MFDELDLFWVSHRVKLVATVYIPVPEGNVDIISIYMFLLKDLPTLTLKTKYFFFKKAVSEEKSIPERKKI